MENEKKTREKLTADNMNWGHFEARKRYIKNEEGEVIGTRYDRLFIGLRPAGRAWLEARYTGDQPVMVFMLGNKNVVFTHREGEATVYANKKAGTQAREYLKFYVAKLGEQLGTQITVTEVEDLPTQTIQRNSTAKAKNLAEVIAAACGREVEDLGI